MASTQVNIEINFLQAYMPVILWHTFPSDFEIIRYVKKKLFSFFMLLLQVGRCNLANFQMNSQLNVILGYFMYMYLQIKLVYMSHYAFSSYIHTKASFGTSSMAF